MKKYALYFLLILLASCSVIKPVGNFAKKRFSNFTTYYNKMYNAKKLFAEAQGMALNRTGRPSSQAMKLYNSVIEKCGSIYLKDAKGKYADDAVFLMAKSMYYKKTGYRKAIDKFKEFIQFYPDSPFIPEAHVYLAKALYQSHQKDKAKEYLLEQLQVPSLYKNYPKFLITLADFYLQEDNFIQAESYLRRIVNEFQKSDEYYDAKFVLGKNLNENKKYRESNIIFESLAKERIPKTKKLDCRYYIALNYLHLNEIQKSKKLINKLLKDEYQNRRNELDRAKILKARILAEEAKYDDAIALFNDIIEAKGDSSLIAEAYYYLAELYFIKLQDYESAIENYNKVKQTDKKSKFVDDAINKSAVASQIQAYKNPKMQGSLNSLIQEQLKLAEHYIFILNSPDSADVVYDKILNQKDILSSTVDSITTFTSHYNAKNDSIQIEKFRSFIANVDSLTPDSVLVSYQDSLQYFHKNLTRLDSLLAVKDSYEKQLEDYKKEIIPKIYFLKIWLYYTILKVNDKMTEAFEFLQLNYPENKYYFASQDLLAGREISFLTDKERKVKIKYETAMDSLETNPQFCITTLKEIANIDSTYWNKKAVFSLGHIYYRVLNDSTSARIYLNQAIEFNMDEFNKEIEKYYDGEHFLVINNYVAPKVSNPKAEEVETTKEPVEKLDDIETQDSKEEKLDSKTDEEPFNSREFDKPVINQNNPSTPAPKPAPLQTSPIIGKP